MAPYPAMASRSSLSTKSSMAVIISLPFSTYVGQKGVGAQAISAMRDNAKFYMRNQIHKRAQGGWKLRFTQTNGPFISTVQPHILHSHNGLDRSVHVRGCMRMNDVMLTTHTHTHTHTHTCRARSPSSSFFFRKSATLAVPSAVHRKQLI
jgi:hypothetical protein